MSLDKHTIAVVQALNHAGYKIAVLEEQGCYPDKYDVLLLHRDDNTVHSVALRDERGYGAEAREASYEMEGDTTWNLGRVLQALGYRPYKAKAEEAEETDSE